MSCSYYSMFAFEDKGKIGLETDENFGASRYNVDNPKYFHKSPNTSPSLRLVFSSRMGQETSKFDIAILS